MRISAKPTKYVGYFSYSSMAFSSQTRSIKYISLPCTTAMAWPNSARGSRPVMVAERGSDRTGDVEVPGHRPEEGRRYAYLVGMAVVDCDDVYEHDDDDDNEDNHDNDDNEYHT